MANPITDSELIKALDEIDVMALIDKQIEKLTEASPDDWTVKRMMEERPTLTTPQARKILQSVFEPLVVSGHYERMKFKNPVGGGSLIGYRKIEK